MANSILAAVLHERAVPGCHIAGLGLMLGGVKNYSENPK